MVIRWRCEGDIKVMEMAKRAKKFAPPEARASCSICSAIPPKTGEFWKGGDLQGSSMPAATAKLEIVGWPYFTDSTSSSNRCIKRCPECGGVYLWETEYDYLVNGSEDDITMTRLSDAEVKKAVKNVLAAVEAAKKHFLEESQVHVMVLEQSTDADLLYKAAFFFDYHQRVLYEDISFAVPALVTALLAHIHKAEKCLAGSFLQMPLRAFMEISAGNEDQIKAMLAAHLEADLPPEASELYHYLPSSKSRDYWAGKMNKS